MPGNIEEAVENLATAADRVKGLYLNVLHKPIAKRFNAYQEFQHTYSDGLNAAIITPLSLYKLDGVGVFNNFPQNISSQIEYIKNRTIPSAKALLEEIKGNPAKINPGEREEADKIINSLKEIPDAAKNLIYAMRQLDMAMRLDTSTRDKRLALMNGFTSVQLQGKRIWTIQGLGCGLRVVRNLCAVSTWVLMPRLRNNGL